MDDEKKSGGAKLRQPKKASATVDSSAVTLDSASLESIRLLIRSELDPLKIELAKFKRDNNMLKEIVASQQTMLEKQEIEKRANNIIVSGLPDNGSTASDLSSVNEILETVRSSYSNPPLRIIAERVRRIGKSSKDRPRLLVATLEIKEHRSEILRNSKNLKENLSPNLPDLTRKENGRLRKAFKNSCQENPGSKVSIKFGKLLVNDVVTDHFNIGNQLFREQ